MAMNFKSGGLVPSFNLGDIVYSPTLKKRGRVVFVNGISPGMGTIIKSSRWQFGCFEVRYKWKNQVRTRVYMKNGFHKGRSYQLRKCDYQWFWRWFL